MIKSEKMVNSKKILQSPQKMKIQENASAISGKRRQQILCGDEHQLLLKQDSYKMYIIIFLFIHVYSLIATSSCAEVKEILAINLPTEL